MYRDREGRHDGSVVHWNRAVMLAGGRPDAVVCVLPLSQWP